MNYENFREQLKNNIIVRPTKYKRLLICEHCDMISDDSQFITYGGVNRANIGTCKKCYDEIKPFSNVVINFSYGFKDCDSSPFD